MSQIFAITFPIYAAISIGYLIVAKGWFSTGEMRVLGKYVLNIALPALLFNAIASRNISEVFHPGYMLVYMAGGLATIVVAWGWFTLTGTDKAHRAIAIMGTSCPNSGFVGYPVMLLAFPDIADIILALNFLVENFMLVPICLILMELAKDGQTLSIPRTVMRALWGVLRRPLVIGLILGLAVSLLQIPIPEMANRLFSMVAASAAALSLIVVGGSLDGLNLSGNQWRAVQVATGKLLLQPSLTVLAAMALPLMGLVAMAPDMHAAVILSAAMPMFGIYTVLAQELDLEGAASVAMLVATVMAFFTLSAFLLWLS